MRSHSVHIDEVSKPSNEGVSPEIVDIALDILSRYETCPNDILDQSEVERDPLGVKVTPVDNHGSIVVLLGDTFNQLRSSVKSRRVATSKNAGGLT